ncbi:site-specific integrase [Paenibacillus ferrarius]|uniref:site-specific integrase n=1 Tax=Paenibacillus ferrarius TaxID=1469647 RepID=UPI003D2CDB51
MSLSNIISMPIKLPLPTEQEPLVQVDYIFDKAAEMKNKSRHGQILSSKKWYKKFLEATANYDESLIADPKFYLNKHWDEFSLVKFETFINETNVQTNNPNYITTSTVHGILYNVKQVMEYAIHKKLAASDQLFPVAIPEPVRETTTHEAYSDHELDQITSAIQKELSQVMNLINNPPYEKKGNGRDPRLKPPRKLGRGFPEGWGWKYIDNVQWYFENVLNCIPVFGTEEYAERYSEYFSAISRYYSQMGGLRGIYDSFGVVPYIHIDLIMPLLIKFIAETGMNPDSALNLTLNCYEDEHPLSGVPYIKYYKERSTGEKELHLSLYDKNTEIKEFKMEEARIIKRTIERVKQVTKEIRSQAPAHMQQQLFIYQQYKNPNIITDLDNRATSDWCRKMIDKYNMVDTEGRPLNFNLVRFRPTKITNLVRKGYDFFEIMAQAGHASITTTLRYLSKRNLDVTARREILNALETIHQNQLWLKENTPSYYEDGKGNSTKSSSIIYKGIVADCKNPFDPPEQVKHSSNYESNKACTRFNMCLFCKNVIIMKHHLPMLAIYKKQIEQLNMNELPNSFFYDSTLSIIEKILDPTKSEFEEADIQAALDSATYMDIFIDPATYRPVNEEL